MQPDCSSLLHPFVVGLVRLKKKKMKTRKKLLLALLLLNRCSSGCFIGCWMAFSH